jgi:hypothetical protein
MLDRVSTDTQVDHSRVETPKPQEHPDPPTENVFTSNDRLSDLAFQGSVARFRVLNNSAAVVPAKAPPQPSPVRQDVVDAVVDSFDYTPVSSWQDRLLYVLREDTDVNLTHEEQMAVIGGLTDKILDEKYAGDLLRSTFLNFDVADLRNVGYDNQKFLAGLMGDAYQSGYISSSDLRQMAEKIGSDDTQALVLNLASNPNNVANSGSDRIVEALGREAQSLGYDTAAALAFTSSESLINEHYTTAQAQRDAFDLVRGYIEDFDESGERAGFYTDYTGESATLRADFTQALLNASRLTANGNGYSQGEFDDLLKDLGPDLVNEAIARAGNIEADDQTNNALDLLGDAASRIAQSSSGDDQSKWQLNADIAYTQSPALINSNLTTAQTRLDTFNRLNQQLVDLRDDVHDAEGRYTLLKQPAILEGLTTLLENNGPEILSNKLNTSPDYQGQADLVQFFQSSIFSTSTSSDVRSRIENLVDSYVSGLLNDPGANSGLVGADIGELLGVINVASARAIEAAPSEQRSEIESFGRSLASKTIGALGGKGLSALITALGVTTTGPVGIVTTTVGGAIISKALDSLFGVNDKPPTREQIEEAFVQAMRDAGIDVNLGESSLDALDQVFNQTIAALEADISKYPVTSEHYRLLDRQIAQLEQLRSTLDSGFLKSITSSELTQELDRRE